MGWLKNLDDEQILLYKFWLPALINGLIVWVLFLVLGDTPLLRSSGLALVIVGVTLALRRMGSAIAIIGGLSLALSPAFWSQTGGSDGTPATIVIALAVAIITLILAIAISKRPYIGLGLGLIVFAGLFWSQIGTPRSIRLTGFIIAWLLYLLIDMLLLTNPRPEDAPLILGGGGLKAVDGAVSARPYHIFGILLLITLGIINDPLVTLLMPTVLLSLLLTNTKLEWWYWLAIGIVLGLGLYGLWNGYGIEQARYLMLGNWRNGSGWIEMIELLINQFTIVGLGLSILGLARLSRWYAPLGIVSMIGFAAYWIFGIIYTGPNQDTLLLPMYIIFVVWMSYAVLAISEWASRTFTSEPRIGRYMVIASYGILPAIMLYRILNI
ncbi:MAG: hypothetical protein Phog2KO_05520 [Phototrophicaceae bacterium]